MRCRICRTSVNLKYTQQELRLQLKRNKNKLRLPLSAIPQTSGNICLDCDERLQNFHEEDDDGSSVVDVDSNIFHENKKRHVNRDVDDNDHNNDHDDDDGRRLFGMQPLQSQSCNLGSDGDAEVIEVLTSRETTPDITANFSPSNIGVMQNAIPQLCDGIPAIPDIPIIPAIPAIPAFPKVIDVIDLVDYEESSVEKEEKRGVKLPISNKTARSDVNETRLLGCLSLISSDSESEIQFEACTQEEHINESESIDSKSKNLKTKSPIEMTLSKGITYDGVECTNNNNLNCENSSIILQHTLPVCGICGISFLDKQSLQDHMQEHEEYKCPACSNRFQMCLDLVYHMRQKHRSYVGNDLCEGARCSQDSAMTIRLRFMQRFTFYECQLCGLIESQFKAHKTHIMQKHADESKSLRDPMMKTQLKCPCCHQNCGTQQIDICRHLLMKHDSIESSKYLHEVKDIESLDFSAKYLRNLQEGARFLTLGIQKKFFIQCLLCRRAFSAPKTFSKHLSGHNIDEWKLFREQLSRNSNTLNTEVDVSKMPLKRKIETRHSGRRENNLKMIGLLSKIERQPPAKKLKLEYETSMNDGVQPKSKKIQLQKISKSKIAQPLSRINSNNSNIKTESNSLTSIDNKRQKKLKHKLQKDSQNKRGQSKTSLRVKAKPALRHFPTQKYNCKYCQLIFKGFRKLQLHLINSHRSDEFHSCDRCSRTFITKTSLEIHCSQNICRRKRKWSDNLDENSNKNLTKQSTPISTEELKNYQKGKNFETSSTIWLKEILQLSKEKQIHIDKNSSTASKGNCDVNEFFLSQLSYEEFKPAHTICRFCSRLFKTAKEFSEHEKTHIAVKDIPWISLVENKMESIST